MRWHSGGDPGLKSRLLGIREWRIGFTAATVVLDVPVTGDADVTVRLAVAAVDAEAIVVAATRANRRIEDEPIRVEVVDREEIEEKLLMTPGDIAMLLNETSGLRVQPTSPTVGGASVRIQGLGGGTRSCSPTACLSTAPRRAPSAPCRSRPWISSGSR